MSEIDATEELDQIDDDRGKPDLGDKRRFSKSRLIIAAIIAAVLGIGALAAYHQFDLSELLYRKEPTPPAPVHSKPGRTFNTSPPVAEAQAATVEKEEPAAAPAEPEEPPETPRLPAYGEPTVRVEAYGQQPQQLSPAEQLHQRRLSSPLSGGIGSDVSAQQVAVTSGPEGEGAGFFGGQEGSGFTERLQPLRLQSSVAGIIEDPHLIITTGTVIGCVLETRIVSTIPGLVVCRTTADVYSASGDSILIDAGSKVVGHYGKGVEQGQDKMFITWNAIESLVDGKIVTVEIDSPAAGALGEAGVGGTVDHHYMRRFGGAILLSFIDDLFAALGRSTTQIRGDSNQVSFTGTADTANGIAEEALKNSINIPPTLTLNQGTRLSIIVARNLNFKEVYTFEPR